MSRSSARWSVHVCVLRRDCRRYAREYGLPLRVYLVTPWGMLYVGTPDVRDCAWIARER